jgi:hypothetical protein
MQNEMRNGILPFIYISHKKILSRFKKFLNYSKQY